MQPAVHRMQPTVHRMQPVQPHHVVTASGAVLYHQEHKEHCVGELLVELLVFFVLSPRARPHSPHLSMSRMRDAAMVVATAVTATVISNQPPAIVTVVTVVTVVMTTIVSHPPS
jgi:hypothetical protein